jgi:hypothetical protein
MRKRSSWRSIYYSGWVVFGLGILNMIWDFSTRVDWYHFDLGLVWANIALGLMGLFAIEIAKSLRGLQDQLDQMEGRTKQMTHDV